MELLGFLLLPIIDMVNRRIKDSDVRFLISIVICGLVGVGLNWIQTQFTFGTPLQAFESISKSVMVVFGMAQLAYRGIWEKSDLREDLGLDATKLKK